MQKNKNEADSLNYRLQGLFAFGSGVRRSLLAVHTAVVMASLAFLSDEGGHLLSEISLGEI